MSGNRWFRHIPKDVDTWLQKSDGKRSPNVSQLNSSPRPHIMHEKRSRFDQGMLWPEEEVVNFMSIVVLELHGYLLWHGSAMNVN